jgi:hypothetical protein
MKNAIIRTLILMMAFLFLNGCGRPDSDVTISPYYNFSSFAGTVYKTKVKVAITDAIRYNGAHDTTLFPPNSFDPTDPNYRPVRDARVIIVLPIGTCLRIDRLIKDNGEWGGVLVSATLINGTNSRDKVFIDREFLAKNIFTWVGWSSSTNWGVNPEMLEAVTNAP